MKNLVVNQKFRVHEFCLILKYEIALKVGIQISVSCVDVRKKKTILVEWDSSFSAVGAVVFFNLLCRFGFLRHDLILIINVKEMRARW